MKKLLFLIGTRPEVIKIAPLYTACRSNPAFITRLAVSGQHTSLLTDALTEAGITPDISFSVCGSLAKKSAECMTQFDAILSEEQPDAVLVHGDTLSAFSGALAAFYKHIPVFHIEAGLRTRDPYTPFPEELYRRTIDTVSALCFAPTENARDRLLREGKAASTVFTVGNTVLDTLRDDIDPLFSHHILKEEKKLVLLTLHRRETQGDKAKEMLLAIKRAVEARTDTHLFFPVHPSPEVKKVALLLFSHTQNVTLSPPVSRRTFRNLLLRATLLLTDSGGASEEATALGIPTLVLRKETERPEGVAAGILYPIGTHADAILSAVTDFLDHPREKHPSDVFGDGRSSERIVHVIEHFFA